MQKKLLFWLAGMFWTLGLWAQAPQGLNYQAVARTSTGAVLVNQAVGIKLTIISGTPTGATAYQETNTATTNQFGLFSVVIGSGTPVSGTLSGVNWAAGPFYLQVALDPTGGTTYANYGSPTQLQSVPYALYAAQSGGGYWAANGNNINNSNTGNVGIGTTNPLMPLQVNIGNNHPAGIFVNTSNISSGATLDLANADTSKGDYDWLGFSDAVAVSPYLSGRVGLQFTDRTNHYGDLVFANRDSSGMTEKMRILSTGAVGIGTSTPLNNLCIVNNGHVSGLTYDYAHGITITDSFAAHTGAGPGIYLENLAATSGSRVAKIATQADATGGGGILEFSSSGDAGYTANGILYLDLTTGRVGIKTPVPDDALSVDGNADNTTGAWGTFSDARIKTVTGEFTDGLNVISQIHTIKFKYNQDAPFQSEEMQIGVVAQELEKVAPYMVSQKEFKNIKDLREVNNQAYVFLLINGVQQQQKMIDELKSTNQQQQADIQTLQHKMDELQKQNAAVLQQVKTLSARVDAATVPATGQLEIK